MKAQHQSYGTRRIEDVYPLTPLQQGILFHALMEPEGGLYVDQLTSELTASQELRPDWIAAALEDLFARHQVLRSAFPRELGGRLHQVVLREVQPELSVLDWRRQGAAERRSSLDALLAEDRRRGFRLDRPPLLRLALIRTEQAKWVVVLTYHHIILDAWSVAVLLRELTEHYAARLADRAPTLPTPRPYRDFIDWWAAQDPAHHEPFWRDYLRGFTSPTDVPLERPGGVRGAPDDPGEVRLVLDEGATERLHSAARQQRLTPLTLVQAAWSLLVARHTGQADVVTGLTLSGRPVDLAGAEQMVGLFINTLPVRLRYDPGSRAQAWCASVQRTINEVRRREATPLSRIVQWSELPSGTSLFQSVLAFENIPNAHVDGSSLHFQEGSYRFRTNYPLNIFVQPDNTTLIRINYDPERFRRPAMERLLRHFRTALFALAERPDARLGDVSILPTRELSKIAAFGRGALRPYADSGCIHQLFENQADRRPEGLAVVSGDSSIRYAELERRANRVAQALRQRGVGPEVRVGILAERSVELVVGLLGVLKASGAYLPLDPSYPRARLNTMVRDAGAALVLVQGALGERLTENPPPLVDLDALARDDASGVHPRPANRAHPDSAAFVIYTSGSTGRPKGAVLAHRGLCNMLEDWNRIFDVGPEDRVLQFASLSFDASVWECFSALISGATLCFGSRTTLFGAREMLSMLRRLRVTRAMLPPSLLGALDPDDLPDLGCLAAIGEHCSRDIVRRWAGGRRFFNAYGPAEATITVAVHEVGDQPDLDRDPPIGRPMANQRTYVLDEDLGRVPIGVVGQLCVAGPGLARGYIGQPGHVAERFVPDPYAEQPGERMYRTGDLARFRSDGEIELVGRADQQVKIRGQRIELGEIEAALARHPDVVRALAAARPLGKSGEARTVAWLKPAGERRPPPEELRDFAARLLPAATVPAAFAWVDSFPLNANGKLDRSLLPTPQPAASAGPRRAGTEPRTPLEALLLQIWREVLSASEVGVDDNYFALGGDSITSIAVTAKARRAGLELGPALLFEHQTIAELARALERSAGDAPPRTEAPPSGPFPPSPIQRWFLDADLADPNHYNQAVAVRIPAEVSDRELRRALQTLHDQRDALRLRARRSPEGWALRLEEPGAPVAYERVDVPHITERHVRRAARRLHLGLDLGRGPVFRAARLAAEDGPHELLLVAHHLCVDAASWRIIVDELPELVAAVDGAESRPAPSFAAWAARLDQRIASGAFESQRQHWQQLLSSIRPLPFDGPGDAEPEGDSLVLKRHVGTGALGSLHRSEELENALLAALGIALTRWSGERAMTVDLESHGRFPVDGCPDPAPLVGWLTCFAPFRVEVPDPDDPAAVLAAVAAQRAARPDPPLGYLALRGVTDRSPGPLPEGPEVSLNFLGQWQSEANAAGTWSTLARDTDPWRSPAQRRRYRVELDAAMRADGLHVRASFGRRTLSSAAADELLDDFTAALRRLLSEVTLEPETPALVPNPAQRYEPFPLTDVQRAYWMGRRDDFHLGRLGSLAYIEIELERLDVERLEACWNRLVARHDMLRAHVLADGRQRVLRDVPRVSVAVQDLRALAAPQVAVAIGQIRAATAEACGDAERWPLFALQASRHPGDRWRLHLAYDPIICDAAGFRLLSHELSLLMEDPEAQLPPIPLSFRDYVLGVERLRTGRAYSRDRAYWLKRAARLPAPPQLPLRGAVGAGNRFCRLRERLNAEDWAALKERARAAHLSPSSVVLTSYAAVLSGWADKPRFTLNLSLFNRLPLHPAVDRIVGDFTSLTLLEVDAASHRSFLQLARAVQQRLWTDLDHRLMSGIEVLRELTAARADGGPALMPVVFTSTLGVEPPSRSAPGVLDGRVVFGFGQTPQVLLDCQIMESQGALHVWWDALEGHFAEQVPETMFDAWLGLLRRLARDHGTWQRPGGPWLTDAVRARRASLNATAAPAPRESLCAALLRRSRQTPDRPAVVTPDRRLTYAQLDTLSAQLATRIAPLLSGPEPKVIIGYDKGWEQIVALLAALRAGGAYVPVDPQLPAPRKAAMLERLGPQLILCAPDADAAAWPAEVPRASVRYDVAACPPSFQDRGVDGDQLAYVIHTSGSTGLPKAVAISHRAALNTVLDVNRRFEVGPEDRVLGLSALSFDLSVYDVFGVLGAGGALVLPDASRRRDPEHWHALIRDHDVTVWNSVPALMEMLLDTVELHERPSLHRLRLVLLSGDWIGLDLAPRLRALSPGIQPVGLGGATEAAIWSVAHPNTDPLPGWSSVPYGRPLANQQVHVLDEALQERPDLAVGELYLSGLGLARCYWGDAAQTARSFCVDGHGRRLYATGDLARFHPDGQLELLGREDRQLKVRGHRIEAAEVEHALRALPGVKAAHVWAPGDPRRRRRLVAHVVLDAGEDRQDAGRLRELLSRRLPAWMVPNDIYAVPSLPLGPTGKVDPRKLPIVAEHGTDDAPTGPGGLWTEVVAGVYAEVLEKAQVGPHDDFFQLGGDSLSGAQIATSVRRRLGVGLSLRQLFELRTPARVARALDTASTGAAVPEPVAHGDTGPVPLAPDQQRLWFLDRLDPGDPRYNIAGALDIRGSLSTEHVRLALDAVTRRHPMLRTRFVYVDDEVHQHVVEAGSARLDVCDLRRNASSEQALEEALHRARTRRFDLGQELPFYAQLLRLEDERHVLVFVLHHIAADAWSLGVLASDFQKTCRALRARRPPRLPPLPLQYSDYVRWRLEQLDGRRLGALRRWWAQRLDSTRVSRLPAGATASQSRGMLALRIDAQAADALRRLARQRSAGLFSVLLAALGVVLRNACEDDDLMIGTSIADRRHRDFDDVIGCFVNLLLVRIDASGEPSFGAFVDRTRAAFFDAHAHRDLPFDEVVRILRQGDAIGAGEPAIRIMFVLQNSRPVPLEIEGLDMRLLPVDLPAARYELHIALNDTGTGALEGRLWWNGRLDADRVADLADGLVAVTSRVCEDPQCSMASLGQLLADTARAGDQRRRVARRRKHIAALRSIRDKRMEKR